MDAPQPTQPSSPPDTKAPLFPLGNWMWRQARKVVVSVIGTTVLLIGVIMVIAPGPAFIVIPCGLAILATEFVWAKRLLDYAKRRMHDMTHRSPSKDPPQQTQDK